MRISRRFAVTVATAALLGAGGAVAATAAADPAPPPASTADGAPGEVWKRTELYFGTGRPDGGVVTEREFADFTATEVTPRFPDGFTQLEGTGQWRSGAGAITRERSVVLVLLYPFTDRDANADLERIRSDYRKLFDQESVLRTDSVARVSF
ncbi:DUF3574 domain-containing protein [Amycolatopsis jiangsuensis]|uniref:DUF3574 domain-containing protein n=1 Tax=Amycolatopsis jiangsuensis TaxID=1181879 RepID=A0A840IYV2_9PSEU|nr:DUF3574 domain-containing protein [Amycolatopsis jiangsuensis]MBB4686382.1 hypothetical protein [Amycolatopsis jiangsuensis]